MTYLKRRFLALGLSLLLLITALCSFANAPLLAQNCNPMTSIVRVSVASNQAEVNGDSWSSSLSADGRFVAFDSYATNIVSGDTNNESDVFVHDRQTGETVRISVATGGGQGNGESKWPKISSDGRFVAFESSATNLVPNDNNGATDIFIYDWQLRQTKRVSVSSANLEANDNSFMASLSANGDVVAFSSYASDLVPGDTNGVADVFIHDNQTGQTTRVPVMTVGVEPNGYSSTSTSALSGDGRLVVFTSAATNLVPDDTNGTADVFVYDQQTGQTKRVSIASNSIEGNAYSEAGVLSADGRYVAFLSHATNLIPEDTNNVDDIFLVEWETKQVARVSVASDGTQANNLSYYPPALSADGQRVVFSSIATNLVSNDTSEVTDIFIRDQQLLATKRVSLAVDGSEGDDLSNWPAIASNGGFVAFSSDATNLVSGDTNNVRDLFVVALDCQIEPTPEVTPTEEVTPLPEPTSLPAAIPHRNYVTTQPVLLTWNSVTWATQYEVQVDTTTAFSAPPVVVFSSELQLPTLNPRTYYWRVRAIRANGTAGAWSIVESFAVAKP